MFAKTFSLTQSSQLVFFFLCAFVSHQIWAQTSCASIQCDCSALPKAEWKGVCSAREAELRKKCEGGDLLAGLYCTAHGPIANRLPLAIKLDGVDIVPVEKLPGLYKQVAAIYWSTRKDLESLQSDIASSKKESALAKADLLHRNIETLFEIQKQITVSWRAQNDSKEAVKAWRDFANDTLDVAEKFDRIGHNFISSGNVSSEESQASISALALGLMEDAGEVYEQAAYAFGQSGQHDLSAKTWKKAADVSAYLMSVYDTENMPTQKLQTLKYQQAARLYRASFHWVKSEQEGEAEDSLKKAQELFSGKAISVPG